MKNNTYHAVKNISKLKTANIVETEKGHE